ncbi:hypothetical protein GGR92_005219 [Spirosoma lacussanchae]|uniref:hypothetical protein n=1 Tax=Spirosoma lacussanchae TaxID=1884249 RepID=UPI001109BD7F|nr:hypothetical protein [Spirosoma lacussanchae]
MTIRQQVVDRDSYWNSLLLNLSEGRPEGITALRQMDTIDFWHYYAAWCERQSAIENAYKTT